MKVDFNKLKSADPMTKKLMKMIVIGFIVIIIGIVTLVLLKLLFFNRISVRNLETKMEAAARNYYLAYPELLPEQDKETTSITIEQLVEQGKLKPLDKLLKEKDASCQGKVTVTRNGSYYLYTTDLDCKDLYKTKKLYEEITSSKNIVTEKDGLYHINDDYIYRGEKVNNYIKFAGQTWRILKVDGTDNTIRILQEKSLDKGYVWDDRYNSSKESDYGINEYDTSRLKDILNELWIGNEIFTNNEKAYLVSKPLCVSPRSQKETDKTGSVECQLTYGEQTLSLLQPNEYLMASLDKQCLKTFDSSCSNYNYLYNVKDNNTYWSITPVLESSYQSYTFSPTIGLSRTSKTNKLKFTVSLSSEVTFLRGDGTIDNPYIIK